jgi:RNA polymerase sigma-70 factor, ECF subfamily
VDRLEASQWMDRASSGDGEAFSLLAGATQDAFFRFALAQGLRRADAAEAVQETFLRAWRGRLRWRKGANAVAWMYGISMNVVRELRRRRGRHAGVDLDTAEMPAPPGPDLGERERLDAMADAVADLPDRQREAVTCRYLLQMSVRETADAMGCAEGTVKAAVHAALGNLRNLMEDET